MSTIISNRLKLVHQWMVSDPGRASMTVMSIVMFVVYLIIPLTSPHTFISPDETANALFAQRLAVEGRLWYIEPLNLDALDRIHPRATESHGGLVHPSGMWGIALIFGAIANYTGITAAHILTAAIALLAVWLFTAVIEHIFDTHTATISFFLILTHPAWWYYASRGWHHNVLFVSLLMILAWVMIKQPWSTPSGNTVAAASLAILITLTRPVELIWLIPAALLIRFISPRHKRVIDYAIASALIVAGGILVMQTQLFQAAATLTPPSDIPAIEKTVLDQLFPFGFSVRTLARSVMWYGFAYIWWFTAPTLIGMYYILKRHRPSRTWFAPPREFGERKEIASPFNFGRRPEQQAQHGRARGWYVVITMAIAAMLMLWYGSWRIADNPDAAYISLAQSYVRYWLPIYILAVPLAVRGMMVVARAVAWRHTLTATMVVMVALSAYTVLSGRDGIPAMIRQLRTNHEIAQTVFTIVPENAIIITDRHDKLFVPHRRVMFPIDHPGTFESMRAVRSAAPLYIYDERMTDEERDAYSAVLAQMNLKLESEQSFGNEELYAIIP